MRSDARILFGIATALGSTAGTTPLLLGIALAGCTPEERTFPTEERYARLFRLPRSAEWQLESTVPPPQTEPRMLMWELTRYPGAEATPEQRQAAADFIERCERAAVEMNWESFETATAAGFELLDRRHYYNEEYILDDRILDPERPEHLMYYDAPEGKRLVGYMFYVRSLTEEGPQFGGPLTIWHYHVWNFTACHPHGVMPLGPQRPLGDHRPCPPDTVPSRRSPEMLHVWLVDRPQGPYSTSMFIHPDQVQKALEKRDRVLRLRAEEQEERF